MLMVLPEHPLAGLEVRFSGMIEIEPSRLPETLFLVNARRRHKKPDGLALHPPKQVD